ncbi:uncharacterized protein [Procambarus clarkii]|uniref:uncharacterized protein n=1 Tax=Procambarus clarkii TaxID=6728 RepID=UPI003743B58E
MTYQTNKRKALKARCMRALHRRYELAAMRKSLIVTSEYRGGLSAARFSLSCQYCEGEEEVATLRKALLELEEDMSYAVLDDDGDQQTQHHSAERDSDKEGPTHIVTSTAICLQDLGLMAAYLGLHAGRVPARYRHPFTQSSIYSSVDSVARAQAAAYAMWGVHVGDIRRRPGRLSQLSHHRRQGTPFMWRRTVSDYFRHLATPSPLPDHHLVGSCSHLSHPPVLVHNPLAYPLRTFDEHLRDLTETLTLLDKAGFKLNVGKCTLASQKFKFLVFQVCTDGIRPDPDSCRAIADMPTPKTAKDVNSNDDFVGSIIVMFGE